MATQTSGTTNAPLTPGQGAEDVNGLRITWSNFFPDLNFADYSANLSYYPAEKPLKLPNAKVAFKNLTITPGGALKDLPARSFAVTSPETTIGFDADQNGILDSFFLQSAQLVVNRPLTVAGILALEGVNVQINELTNHPTVARKLGQSVGTWNGAITLSGTRVTIPSIPQLAITPLKQGGKAWQASYNLSSGQFSLNLSKASYNSSRLQLAFTNTQLSVGNNAKDVALSGQGQFSLPELGFKNLRGSLAINIANKALSSIAASVEVPAATPITNLGLSGRLAFSHNSKTKTGNIAITDGVLAGIGVNGNLNYTVSGAPANDKITGQLSFDNTTQRNGLSVDIFDKSRFSIVPLSGAMDFAYAPRGAATPGGHLKFANINFDIITGAVSSQSKASFVGNLNLSLDASGKPSISSLDLTLKEAATLDLGIGLIKAESDNGAPVRFTLQKGKNPDGSESTRLVPTLTGLFSYVGNNRSASFKGIEYKYEPDFNSYQWSVSQGDLNISSI